MVVIMLIKNVILFILKGKQAKGIGYQYGVAGFEV